MILKIRAYKQTQTFKWHTLYGPTFTKECKIKGTAINEQVHIVQLQALNKSIAEVFKTEKYWHYGAVHKIASSKGCASAGTKDPFNSLPYITHCFHTHIVFFICKCSLSLRVGRGCMQQFAYTRHCVVDVVQHTISGQQLCKE